MLPVPSYDEPLVDRDPTHGEPRHEEPIERRRAERLIRVLIAEDHGVVRAGLVQLLLNARDLEVVGAASGGREAVTLRGRRCEPDVVLMDLAMPDLDGIAATKAIHATAPGVRVVILTSFFDPARVLSASSTPAPPATCSRRATPTSCTARSGPRPAVSHRCRRRRPAP